MTNEMRFLIESLTTDLSEMLMEEYGWDMKKALDELFVSETFSKICNPKTGLFYESPLYVFSYLKNELEIGKVA